MAGKGEKRAAEAEPPPDESQPTSTQDTSSTSLSAPEPSQPTSSPTTPAPPPPQSTNSKRIQAIEARIVSLQSQIATLTTTRDSLVASFPPPTSTSTLPADEDEGKDIVEATLARAKAIRQRHIRLLNEYNEIKDVAQGLFGLIAEERGVKVGEVQEGFGVGVDD